MASPCTLGVVGDPPAAPALIVDAVRAWCEWSAVFPDGASVVVACSGGADSVCLLAALSSLPLRLRAVYVDHGLRPHTDAEAALVSGVAGQLGASFERVRVEVHRTGNLLAAARQARYRALCAAARRVGASVIAVGHTASDQAETVAFHHLRGDPSHSLAGMSFLRPLRGAETGEDAASNSTNSTDTAITVAGAPFAELLLVRPLLGAGVRRHHTAAFVTARSLPSVDDPTNHDRRYTRVRLRGELEAAGPEATDALLALSAQSAAQLHNDEAAAAALGDPLDLEAALVAIASEGVLLRLLHRAGLHRAGHAHARALAALAAGTHGS